MGNIQAFKMRLDKFFAGYLSSPEYTCDFTNGHGSIKGAVKLMNTEKGTVVLNGVLDAGDNTEGMHGFHVHAEGKISPDCTAAGGHFKSNPDQIHGYPNYILPDRHTGDLGNVAVNKGKIEVNIEDTRISLDPTRDDFIGDKAIVIHALQDDGNPTRDPSSTGAAGARVGCCLIQPISYQCDFRAGHGIIKGVIDIKQEGDEVSFSGELSSEDSSFTNGNHGFHVHAVGNVFPDCTAAGGHFKGSPDQIHCFPYFGSPDRHTGDLGNITVEAGASRVDITDSMVSLVKGSDNDITDKAIVIHALPDDGNPDREESSTGAAGARLGCCLIEKSTSGK